MSLVTLKVNRFTLALGAAIALLAVPIAHAEDGEYGVLMKTLSNPFWGAMSQGVEEGAKAAGVKYFLQAAESDQAAEPQLNLCNTMLERKPVAMITAAINSTNLLPCLKAAQDAGIKVVDLDGNLDQSILDKEGIKITFRIGSDNVAAGGQGAEYLVVQARQGRQGSGAGHRGPVRQHHRPEARPGLCRQSSRNWRRGSRSSHRCRATGTAARRPSIANDILTRNPDLVAIFAANDGMALGAVESVYAAGKGEQVTIIGVDGNSDAVKSIKEGRLNASVAQLPYLVGKQAVENVKKALAGETVRADVAVPTLVLTKEVLEAGKEPMLEYVK